MKIKHLLFGLLGLTACTSDLEEQQVTSELESITMNAKDFEYDNDKQGRTSFEISNSGAGFTWAANDVVGICPSEGTQVGFPMAEGAGTKTASFTGGGWALMPSAKYMAYYPIQGDIFLDKTAIPVSYENQTQTGISSTAHLGKCDFMAAAGNTPNSGNVFFNFEHLGSLVEMTITLPRATTYTGVTLTCEEAPIFTTKGKIDLTAAQPAITTVTPSQSISINLNNFTTTEANQAVKVYFMAAPVNLNGKTVTVNVISKDYNIYSGSFTSAKDWLAGKAYRCAVTTTETGSAGLPYYIGFNLDKVLTKKGELYPEGSEYNNVVKSYEDFGRIGNQNEWLEDIDNNPKFEKYRPAGQDFDAYRVKIEKSDNPNPNLSGIAIAFPEQWGEIGVYADEGCSFSHANYLIGSRTVVTDWGDSYTYNIWTFAGYKEIYYIRIKNNKNTVLP